MLTRCIPLSKSAADFDGVETVSEEGQLRDYICSCGAEFEKMPGFSGGLVLICLAGIGYNFVVGLNQDIPQWHIHVATLPEWLILTALGDCTAMRLWKLGEHEAVVQGYGVKIFNLSGLLNLYAFWKSNGFRLVPRGFDARSLHMLNIACDFGATLRLETKQRKDVHRVRTHGGQRWVQLTRQNTRPLFKEDGEIRLYANFESITNGNLLGCIKRDHRIWWVIAPPRQENVELNILVLRLWECVEAWVARIAILVEREWPDLPAPSIEIQMVMPNLTIRVGERGNSG